MRANCNQPEFGNEEYETNFYQFHEVQSVRRLRAAKQPLILFLQRIICIYKCITEISNLGLIFSHTCPHSRTVSY